MYFFYWDLEFPSQKKELKKTSYRLWRHKTKLNQIVTS